MPARLNLQTVRRPATRLPAPRRPRFRTADEALRPCDSPTACACASCSPRSCRCCSPWPPPGPSRTVVFSHTLQQRVADQLSDAADVLTGSGLPYTPELLRRVADLQQAGIKLFDRRRRRGDQQRRPAAAAVMAALRAPGATVRAGAHRTRRRTVVVVARRWPRGDDAATGHGGARRLPARRALRPRDVRRSAWAWRCWRRVRCSSRCSTCWCAASPNRCGSWPPWRTASPPDGATCAPNRPQAARSAALATSLNQMTARLASYEAELADRSRLAALGELSARIAHEIRNPLTGLKLHLQLLAESATGGAGGHRDTPARRGQAPRADRRLLARARWRAARRAAARRSRRRRRGSAATDGAVAAAPAHRRDATARGACRR